MLVNILSLVLKYFMLVIINSIDNIIVLVFFCVSTVTRLCLIFPHSVILESDPQQVVHRVALRVTFIICLSTLSHTHTLQFFYRKIQQKYITQDHIVETQLEHPEQPYCFLNPAACQSRTGPCYNRY